MRLGLKIDHDRPQAFPPPNFDQFAVHRCICMQRQRRAHTLTRVERSIVFIPRLGYVTGVSFGSFVHQWPGVTPVSDPLLIPRFDFAKWIRNGTDS